MVRTQGVQICRLNTVVTKRKQLIDFILQSNIDNLRKENRPRSNNTIRATLKITLNAPYSSKIDIFVSKNGLIN